MDTPSGVLRDIHGLDAIPWWPLATGWWFVIVVAVVLLLFIGIRYWLTSYTVWFGWRGDARRQLRALKKALKHENPHVVAGKLSELVRRIAMVHGGRQQTAGLIGDNWLHWLAKHDNSGFDWEQRGQMLLTAPYMPPSMQLERSELVTLINAAIRWLSESRATRKKSPQRKREASHV